MNMAMLKHLPLMAFIALTSLCAKAGSVQSYSEWKNTRIQQAQQKVSTLKTQIDQKKITKRDIAQGKDPNLALKQGTEASSGPDAQVEKLEKQLQQEAYSLDMAKDLTVSDYFAGYLTKMQDKKSAFNEVAGKLSPQEVAELMNAYANSVFGSHAGDLPNTATAPARDLTK